jgi:hypothetical protein
LTSLRKRRLCYLVCTAFLLVSLHAFAQQTEALKISLRDAFIQIENAFNIKFSYQDAIVEGRIVSNVNSFNSLEEALNFLRKQSDLNYQKIDDRFIAVTINQINRICGIVKNINTNTVLEGASVTILNSNKGTNTSKEGAFSLNNISSEAILKFSFVGFESLEVSAKEFEESKNCSTIFMIPYVQELEEVVLLNVLSRGIDEKLDGSIQLTPKDFGILPGLSEPDVLQTIQALPGIESVNETISNINIRGGTHDQNLILWDGIKMYSTGHFFGLISAFNPYLTEKVAVYKNGTSAFYNDGVSSLINMETSDQITEKFSGGSGFNLISADAFAKIPISKK